METRCLASIRLKEVHQITVCDELRFWWTSLFSPSSTKAGLVGLYSKSTCTSSLSAPVAAPTSQLWIHDPMIDVTRVDTVVWSHSKMIYIHVILKDGSDEVTIQA